MAETNRLPQIRISVHFRRNEEEYLIDDVRTAFERINLNLNKTQGNLRKRLGL